MPGAVAQIKAARALLGTTEHPPGSNHNDITVWYNAHIAWIGDGAWCDMSVTKEAYDSGNEAAVVGGPGKGFAYVPSHTRFFSSRGQWKYGAGDLKPGDVVFFEWGRRRTLDADHVGLVEKVFADGRFYSLEGNISDRFQRVHRDGTYVAGRGRPAYTSTSQEDDMQLKDVVNSRGWTVGECLQAAKQQTDELEPLVKALTAKVDALTKTVADIAAKIK